MNEDLKRTWQDTKFRGADKKNLDEVVDGRKITALQSLARRYRRFSVLSAVMIPCSLTVFNITFLPERVRLVATLSFAVYFLIASLMDMWLGSGISSIDCCRMTVKEVAGKAVFYRRRHLQFIMVLLPMALSLVGLLAWEAIGESWLFVAIVIGFLFGLAVGYRYFREFMADYRRLTD